MIAEILLNLLGIDDLADYSEFVFERDLVNLEKLTILIGILVMAAPINKNFSSGKKQLFQKKGVLANYQKTNVLHLSTRQKIYHCKSVTSRSVREKLKIYRGEHLQGKQFILRLAKAIVPGILPWVCLWGGYGFIISLFDHWELLPSILDSKAIANAMVGLTIAFSLLLVFRANSARDRFWEGRKLWARIVNVIRNTVRGIWLYIGEKELKDRQKESAMRLVAAFAVVMKLHLRKEPINSELDSWVSPLQYRRLHNSDRAPLEIALWISDYLHRQYEHKQLTVFQLKYLQSCIDEMVDIFEGCGRFFKTPVPLVYTIVLKTLLIVCFLMLPLGMVGWLGWGTGLVIAFISFIYLSISEIGAEIEKPFGRDPNDLPLDLICDIIKCNVEYLIQQASNSRSRQIINLPKKAA